MLERLFHHGNAFFDALAQRTVDFLLPLAERKSLIGNIQRSEHGYF